MNNIGLLYGLYFELTAADPDVWINLKICDEGFKYYDILFVPFDGISIIPMIIRSYK